MKKNVVNTHRYTNNNQVNGIDSENWMQKQTRNKNLSEKFNWMETKTGLG